MTKISLWDKTLFSQRICEEMPKCIIKLALTHLLFIKVHSDFVGAATRGAMAVIDGNVMAINPGEDAK